VRRVYIEFNHAPHIICVAEDDGQVRRYKRVEIKGPSSVVSVEERNGIGQKQAWVEVQDGIEVEGIDEKMNKQPATAASDFYRQGADAYFKKHLAHLIGLPNLRFLEVGSYAGSSAVGVIEDILTDKSSTITCVDIWYSPFAEDKFNEVTANYKEQVIKQVAWSAEWLKKNQKKQFDFIYIDGDHSAEAVKIDMELSWNILKSGGIMAIDDYNYPHPRGEKFNQKPAIDAFINSVNAEVLEIDEQVWLKKLQNN
jgi:predicted O-methyltransferase YrrM